MDSCSAAIGELSHAAGSAAARFHLPYIDRQRRPRLPPTLTATQTPTLTAIPSLTPTPEPLGCQKPPEDYTRVEVNNGETINQRTLAMLTHAQELYGGEIELTGYAITQGSYRTLWSFLWHTFGRGRGRSLGPASGDLYCVMG